MGIGTGVLEETVAGVEQFPGEQEEQFPRGPPKVQAGREGAVTD